MWWQCDVKLSRTVLRLKVWAKNEHEARAKIERMYQVATIQSITLADDAGLFPVQEKSAGLRRQLIPQHLIAEE